MYCNCCQSEFEPWKDEWGMVQKFNCKSCREKRRIDNKPFNFIDHYCVVCGIILPKTTKRTRGITVISSAPFMYCALHKPLHSKKIRHCVICDKELGRAYKYCDEHKPKPDKIDPILNRRTSIAWQKNNPQKVSAAVFARIHPHETYVLYECRCDHPSKHNHHFNYELKNLVIRLCPACHSAEHKRLRSLQSVAFTE